jgi:hypothetical protein
MTSLDPVEDEQFRNEVHDYVAKHDIPGIFQHLMSEVAVNKPKDPISFLIGLLEKPKKGFRRIVVLGKKSTRKEELCKRIAETYDFEHINIANDTVRNKAVRCYLMI